MDKSNIIYGAAFSPEVINGQPIPKVSRDLLPWLIKDRNEAITGSSFFDVETGKQVHDRMGLDYAKKELKRITSELDELTSLSSDGHSTRIPILKIQQSQQRAFVQFWEGKITLLDRMIENIQNNK